MADLRPFVKKDIAVQAERLTPENALDLAIALNLPFLRTGGGQMLVQVAGETVAIGDWIVQQPGGSITALSDTEFQAQYTTPEEDRP